MPSSHELSLSGDEAALRAATGRQLHGLACHLLERPVGAAHDAQVKFFTVWPLESGPAGPGHALLRLHWLRDDIDITSALSGIDRTPLRLGGTFFTARLVQSRHTTFQQLRALPPVGDMTFEFLSPTYFSRSGRDYLLPDPELIVRRLVARWNQCLPPRSDCVVTGEQAKALGARVELVGHSLETAAITTGRDRGQTGFVGTARVGLSRARGRSTEAGRLLSSLAAFANFSGLGAQTTHGCGAVRAWRDGDG